MDELDATNCPANMVLGFKQLQNAYNETMIYLQLGTELHGAHTNMDSITVGIDQMMLTILPNFHKVPSDYMDSSAFFVVGHEFGHITTHPGKNAEYWKNGAKDFPVEHYQKQRWLNAISDIIVNWSVMTGSNIYDNRLRDEIQPQMLKGFIASEMLRVCSIENTAISEGQKQAHMKLLKEKKVKDNRYTPVGGLPGQYDFAESSDPYQPTTKTPFYQKFVGHGRGSQIYPPISYCVSENMAANWRRVRMLKTENGLQKGKTYEVSECLTFDGRKNQPWEPVDSYVIDGKEVSARYCLTLCPDCGKPARNTWDNWFDYVPKEEQDANVQRMGTWLYLLIQMFAFQWAAIYSTYLPYGGSKSRTSGKQFLRDISETMDKCMRGK